MSTKISPLTGNLSRLELEGKVYLAVRIGTAQRTRATRQFTDSKTEHGWIFVKEHLSRWPVTGFIEEDGIIYLYGPYYEGTPLREILSYKPENSIPKLMQLAQVFCSFKETDLSLGKIQSDSILFLADGGLLFLPVHAMERIRNSQTAAERLESFERFNNPDLSPEQNISFAFGTMSYKLLTGEYPFKADVEEELHQQARELMIPSPRHKNPEISEDASAAVMNALGKTKKDPPTVEEWAVLLRRWTSEGFTVAIPDDERRRLLSDAERIEKKGLDSYARKTYFRKHGRTLAVIGIAAVFVISLAVSILRNVLAPPVTLGMQPREVVELFYSAQTELDHETIEDCLAKGVAEEISREAVNLFVITRQRMGTEGTTGLAPADLWVEAGRPDIRETMSVYGIAELVIIDEGDNTFIAEYEKWQQISSESPSRAELKIGAEGYYRIDRLVLRKHEKKDYWEIVSIERLEEEPIDVTALLSERDAAN